VTRLLHWCRPGPIVVIFSLLALLAMGTLDAAAATSRGKDNRAAQEDDDRYIVVLRDDVDGRAVAQEHASANALNVSQVYSSALQGYAARIPDEALARIKADRRVAFVSTDGVVTATGTVAMSAGDATPTGVRRLGAATDTAVHQASTVNVAVLDTGISLSHPDLNAVNGKNCLQSTKTAEDDNGHGSHVAGTIGAKNNGSGVVGVAPGTRLYALKSLDANGSGTWSQVICGIDWLTANSSTLKIKVANLSLAGSGANDNNCGKSNYDALHKAICGSVAKGVTYVVAAGNSGTSFSSTIPAAYPEVLTVTAMSDSDGLPGALGGSPSCWSGLADDAYAPFSNYASGSSASNHTIAGPGLCIASTWMQGGYTTLSGTSMATPHVAGSVGLCLGSGGASGPCTGLTPASIIQKLRKDAQYHATTANGFVGDPLHPLSSTKYYGYLAWAGGY
jgi:subtilisin